MDVALFSCEKVEPVLHEFMNECVRLNQHLLHVISFFQIIDRFSLAHDNFFKEYLWLHCELVVFPWNLPQGFLSVIASMHEIYSDCS